MLIEQAIHADGTILARSSGFLDDWTAEAGRLCTLFGERPPGITCPLAVFARPLGRRHVAVAQVADQPDNPTHLAFRLLVLPAKLYAELGGDPFRVSDQFPADWQARGELPRLQWTAGPAPRRL